MNRSCKIGMLMMLCYACITSTVYTQSKPILAVLPFTGEGTDYDRAAIARLLSFELDKNLFDIVSRGNLDTIIREPQFQRTTGLTDSDAISQLGHQYSAQFVMVGHIQTLGASKLLMVIIINVMTLQQIAGDYLKYKTIEELEGLLPGMAKRMMTAAQQDTSKKPRLVVLPVNIRPGTDPTEAEVLVQVLVTELANSGKYAVLPRTTTIQKVMKEKSIQRSGLTDPATIKVIGMATDADYVLAGEVGRLDLGKMFLAQILEVKTARQIIGGREWYTTISDSLKIMAELSKKL